MEEEVASAVLETFGASLFIFAFYPEVKDCLRM